jgi:hypothetical protein
MSSAMVVRSKLYSFDFLTPSLTARLIQKIYSNIVKFKIIVEAKKKK